jgi:hypothetical protein
MGLQRLALEDPTFVMGIGIGGEIVGEFLQVIGVRNPQDLFPGAVEKFEPGLVP